MLSRWSLFAAVVVTALVRVLGARAEPPLPSADADLRAQALDALVTGEPASRREAATSYPTDPWSADDYFHAKERKDARAFAKLHRVPLTDVLDALDEGLRARRSSGDRSIVSTVPPCHPRAIY